MERLKTYNVSNSNGTIKYPIRKSIFAVNLLLKLFSATIANADIGSLLVSPYITLKKYLWHMQVKFQQNRMVLTTQNSELFDKKQGF